MTWLPWAITGLSLLFAARCYRELWKWAKMCQRAHIVIATKGRVQIDASLAEWLGWANQLKGSEANGRVVYRNLKVSVAILKQSKGTTAKTTAKTIRHSQRSRKEKVVA